MTINFLITEAIQVSVDMFHMRRAHCLGFAAFTFYEYLQYKSKVTLSFPQAQRQESAEIPRKSLMITVVSKEEIRGQIISLPRTNADN